jgi:hypothetical protein
MVEAPCRMLRWLKRPKLCVAALRLSILPSLEARKKKGEKTKSPRRAKIKETQSLIAN